MDAGVMLVLAPDGWRQVDPDGALLAGDDLAATRGDGAFESIGVFGGAPLALDPHLDRLHRSMRAVGMSPLDTAVLRAGIAEAVARHPVADELLVRLFVSHGREHGGDDSPTAWIAARENADHRRARRDGVDAVLLRRGMTRAGAADAPWLLPGVKSLSYAVQRAALREARRRGADDAIFVTDDGFALEGAISTVVLRRGGVWITPDPADGALDGTTQRAAFAGLRAGGAEVVVRSVEVDELLDADAVWLCSSGRLIAPVRSIDGRGIPGSAESTRVLWRALGLAAAPAGAPVDEEAPC